MPAIGHGVTRLYESLIHLHRLGVHLLGPAMHPLGHHGPRYSLGIVRHRRTLPRLLRCQIDILDLQEKVDTYPHMTSLAEEWIKNSPHKTWCNQAPGNIYADGEECDCGLEAALKSLSSPAVPKEITLQQRTLEDLINLAAETLPENWEIVIETQQGYGEVIVHNPNGSIMPMFQDDTTITQQFANALSLAKIEASAT